MSRYKAIICPECHRHIILFEIKGTDYEARIKCRLCKEYFIVTPNEIKREEVRYARHTMREVQ